MAATGGAGFVIPAKVVVSVEGLAQVKQQLQQFVAATAGAAKTGQRPIDPTTGAQATVKKMREETGANLNAARQAAALTQQKIDNTRPNTKRRQALEEEYKAYKKLERQIERTSQAARTEAGKVLTPLYPKGEQRYPSIRTQERLRAAAPEPEPKKAVKKAPKPAPPPEPEPAPAPARKPAAKKAPAPPPPEPEPEPKPKPARKPVAKKAVPVPPPEPEPAPAPARKRVAKKAAPPAPEPEAEAVLKSRQKKASEIDDRIRASRAERLEKIKAERAREAAQKEQEKTEIAQVWKKAAAKAKAAPPPEPEPEPKPPPRPRKKKAAPEPELVQEVPKKAAAVPPTPPPPPKPPVAPAAPPPEPPKPPKTPVVPKPPVPPVEVPRLATPLKAVPERRPQPLGTSGLWREEPTETALLGRFAPKRREPSRAGLRGGEGVGREDAERAARDAGPAEKRLKQATDKRTAIADMMTETGRKAIEAEIGLARETEQLKAMEAQMRSTDRQLLEATAQAANARQDEANRISMLRAGKDPGDLTGEDLRVRTALVQRAQAERERALQVARAGREEVDAAARLRVEEAKYQLQVRKRQQQIVQEQVKSGEVGGGTWFQRVQNVLSPASGRLPEENLKGFQFVGDKLQRTLGYAASGALLGAASAGVSEMFRDATQLEETFVRLRGQMEGIDKIEAFGHVREEIRNIAGETGQASNDVAQFFSRMVGLGNDPSRALADTASAMKLATVTGLDMKTMMQSLVPIEKAFGVSAEQIGDEVVAMGEKFGIAEADLVQFLGKTASVAHGSGANFKELTILGANVANSLGKPIESSSEAINKAFGQLENNSHKIFAVLQANPATEGAIPQMIDALSKGDSMDALKVLLKASQDFNQGQKNAILTQVVSKREGEEFNAMIQNAVPLLAQMEDAEAGVADNSGKMEARFRDLRETVALTFKTLNASFEAAGDMILRTGIADVLTDIGNALKLILSPVGAVLKAFTDLNEAFRESFVGVPVLSILARIGITTAVLAKGVHLLSQAKRKDTEETVKETGAESVQTQQRNSLTQSTLTATGAEAGLTGAKAEGAAVTSGLTGRPAAAGRLLEQRLALPPVRPSMDRAELVRRSTSASRMLDQRLALPASAPSLAQALEGGPGQGAFAAMALNGQQMTQRSSAASRLLSQKLALPASTPSLVEAMNGGPGQGAFAAMALNGKQMAQRSENASRLLGQKLAVPGGLPSITRVVQGETNALGGALREVGTQRGLVSATVLDSARLSQRMASAQQTLAYRLSSLPPPPAAATAGLGEAAAVGATGAAAGGIGLFAARAAAGNTVLPAITAAEQTVAASAAAGGPGAFSAGAKALGVGAMVVAAAVAVKSARDAAKEQAEADIAAARVQLSEMTAQEVRDMVDVRADLIDELRKAVLDVPTMEDIQQAEKALVSSTEARLEMGMAVRPEHRPDETKKKITTKRKQLDEKWWKSYSDKTKDDLAASLQGSEEGRRLGLESGLLQSRLPEISELPGANLFETFGPMAPLLGVYNKAQDFVTKRGEATAEQYQVFTEKLREETKDPAKQQVRSRIAEDITKFRAGEGAAPDLKQAEKDLLAVGDISGAIDAAGGDVEGVFGALNKSGEATFQSLDQLAAAYKAGEISQATYVAGTEEALKYVYLEAEKMGGDKKDKANNLIRETHEATNQMLLQSSLAMADLAGKLESLGSTMPKTTIRDTHIAAIAGAKLQDRIADIPNMVQNDIDATQEAIAAIANPQERLAAMNRGIQLSKTTTKTVAQQQMGVNEKADDAIKRLAAELGLPWEQVQEQIAQKAADEGITVQEAAQRYINEAQEKFAVQAQASAGSMQGLFAQATAERIGAISVDFGASFSEIQLPNTLPTAEREALNAIQIRAGEREANIKLAAAMVSGDNLKTARLGVEAAVGAYKDAVDANKIVGSGVKDEDVKKAQADMVSAQRTEADALFGYDQLVRGRQIILADRDPVLENAAKQAIAAAALQRARAEGNREKIEEGEQLMLSLQLEARDNQLNIARGAMGIQAAQDAEDPTKSAINALKAAEFELANAHGEADRAAKQAGVISAQKALNNTISNAISADAQLAITLANLRNDPVAAATTAAAEAKRKLDDAIAKGITDRGVLGPLEGALAEANKQAFLAPINKQIEDLDWLYNMQQISLGDFITGLEVQLAGLDVNSKEYKDLALKIFNLKKGAQSELQWNLPGNLSLPTLYEARRASETTYKFGAGPYQDNRNITVGINVNGTDNPVAVANQVVSALNDSLRGGTTFTANVPLSAGL